MDFFDKTDIELDIKRIDELITSGIFNSNNAASVFVKSAFIEVLICLRDLMYKTEKYGSRVAFTDDVVITSKVKDVTDLIKFVRDALCHPDIPNHYIPNTSTKATYNVAYGKASVLQIGDILIRSDYDDDICFFFGEQKIYMKRHIIRALSEAVEKLSPLLMI